MAKHSDNDDDRSTPMTSEDASRIQSAGDRDPGSRTGQTGFGPRAQSAAAGNAQDDDD
ncbi:hypothetical protein [Candidatus Frankia nodulisporulans]|uniref:hypothetical protein n=1 Tax=Candidatus Frankia nodulisporulans TaxID=2060052 RepID=UPI0013D479DF|nr:hypothetical protein [Candidatus Frankia nodulisporulans]